MSAPLPGPIASLDPGFFWTRISALGVEPGSLQKESDMNRLVLEARARLIEQPAIALRPS